MTGKIISHYKIIDKLGEGGMGEVWLAEDTRLERKVALKFLSREAAADEDRARFLREARAASALDHSNICTLHEIGETDDGRTFLAMAYCEGETIREKIARGPLPLPEALDIAVGVGEGLARAHREGIVHRDIKPANAILTRDGIVKIVDFGLATIAGETRLTRTGTSMGTVAYMSPEQVRGERVDHRADIWALGAMLYEMVVGRPPFESHHEQGVVYGILNDEPEPPTALRTGVPMELDRIVAKALQKDPGQRYQHVEDMLVDLRAARTGTGTTTLSPTATFPDHRTQVSRRRLYVAAGLIVLALAAAGLLLLSPRSRELPRVAVLPFENLGTEDHDYFAAGLTEELISRLSRLQGLIPIGRNSIVGYRDTEKDLSQIARELDADYLLTGTTRWEEGETGDRVRITPHLIRSSDFVEIWSHPYTSDVTGIFGIQSEVAERIASALDIELHPDERNAVQRQPTENLEAYQAFLRGRYYMNLPHYTVEDWAHGMTALQQAVELDSTFALAWAELATVYAKRIYLWTDASPQQRELAREAADRAAELAPDSPEVRLALGLYHLYVFRDTETATGYIRTAAREMPGDARIPKAWSEVYIAQGRFEEAAAANERALELSPQDASLYTNQTFVRWFLRQYPQALATADQAILMSPDQLWPYLAKIFVLWSWKGVTDEGRTAVEAISSESSWAVWTRFWQFLYEGRFREALALLDQTPADWVRTKMWSRPESLLKAWCFTMLDQPDSARAALEQAREELTAEVETYPYDPRYRSSLGIALAGLGEREEAIRRGQEAIDLLPLTSDAFYGLSYLQDMSIIHTLLGNEETALDQLEHLCAIPSWFSPDWLKIDIRYASLRDHPRFQNLIQPY
ncbi:MAG: protein kinase [Candidatus Latescibacteria bacterium]|nr:protein kinase [Candidatus Latescibacterota bacterium]